jgi:U4/U6.U5 tri-snRNP-associated protein 2
MTKKLVDSFEEQKLLEKAQDVTVQKATKTVDGWVQSVQQVPFTFLSLDIPPCPLFRDSHGGLVIPQVPLFQLLKKFDGETWIDQMTKDAHLRKQYRIQKLPRYLVLHLARFTKNNFSLEKNPTIVTFPVRNLEMKHYLCPTNDQPHFQRIQEQIEKCPNVQMLAGYSVEQLQDFIQLLGSPLHVQELQALMANHDPAEGDAVNNENMMRIAVRVVERIELFKSTKYDLIANICHESEQTGNGIDVGDTNSGEMYQKIRKSAATISTVDDVINHGAYKIQLPLKPKQQWFELQDLHVMETTPQQIGECPTCSCHFSSK